MKLIPNWRKSWRMASMRALAAIAVIQSTVFVVPADRLLTTAFTVMGRAFTWGDIGFYATVATAFIGGLGRLIDQPKTKVPPQ